eukprot:365543-Chlamydomonas_euryale.AAC.3
MGNRVFFLDAFGRPRAPHPPRQMCFSSLCSLPPRLTNLVMAAAGLPRPGPAAGGAATGSAV